MTENGLSDMAQIMKIPTDDQEFAPDDAKRRFEATLRGALNTPPQPKASPISPKVVRRRKLKTSGGASSASGGTGQP